MTKHKSVNRYLRDNPDLDDVDHALGRPANPFESYRSHYVTDAHGDLARRMDASPWWKRSVEMNNGNDVVFHVTDQGRQALADYLQADAMLEARK